MRHVLIRPNIINSLGQTGVFTNFELLQPDYI